MSARNKFLILLGVICLVAGIYYVFSTGRPRDLVLIGTVDSNQVMVSARVSGRIQKLLVEEGTEVKQGDLIALLDPAELEAQERAAAATIASLRSKVAETQATEEATEGATSSEVATAQARLQAAQSQLGEAEADLDRVKTDNQRIGALAAQGVASQQDRDRSGALLKAQQARVQSLKDQARAAGAGLNAALARTHQTHAAQSTVAATRAELANAQAQRSEAQIRLGYTRIQAPVSGTVSVRAAREGEVVTPGQTIVTIVDLTDTWVRAAIPETYADHIGLGDSLRIRLPGGAWTAGKVFFKSAEADFATQRDVSRRKRDIKTIVLKVRLDNPRGAFVPGMTAEVLVSPEQIQATPGNRSSGAAGQR